MFKTLGLGTGDFGFKIGGLGVRVWGVTTIPSHTVHGSLPT